jgi:3,4-dihydroxy 2-butanone 4-phosphate synthase / GTP cyclohydrolase II
MIAFCAQHGLRITSVEEIKQHRLLCEVMPRRVAECRLDNIRPNLAGHSGSYSARVIVYFDDHGQEEHLAFVFGEPRDGALVRVHSECLTGDVFGSRRCDCGFQFASALSRIGSEGQGVIVYLRQEGRGIGLGNKLQAYQLQDAGADTVEANLQLGLPVDTRNYRVAAKILSELGLREVRLLTNNPDKVRSLQEHRIAVERLSSLAPVDRFNERYLRAKRDKLGHLL